MARTYNKLSHSKVAHAKPGLHADGGGLYLQCTMGAEGALRKSWFFRYAIGGRERRMGLGAVNRVSLAEARKLADEARRLQRDGIDPLVRREQDRRPQTEAAVTFRQAFEVYFAAKRQTLSNAKHQDQWQSTMKAYVYPVIGDRPVAAVTTGEVLSVLTPIWFDKPETARRVLQRVEAVFKSANLRGHRERASPCVGVAQELGTRHRKVVSHRALPYADIPSFLVRLRTSDRWRATRLALEWLILTATRSGETRLARWSEVNEQAGLWTIPAERMKAKRAHAVPLRRRCIEILDELREVHPAEPGNPLFPGTQARAGLSDMTLTVNRRWIFTPDRRAIETPLVDGLERVGDLSCVA